MAVQRSSSRGLQASWHDRLEAAMTAREVMEVTKDYLEGWEAEDLAALPAACLPPDLFARAEDLVDYAFDVVRHHCGAGSEDPKVAELAAFLGNASRRIAALMGERSRPRALNK